MISLLNPKSYPVMVSVFSALILYRVDAMGWGEFPVFFVFAVLGFALGYLFMVVFSGFHVFVSLYRRRAAFFSYAFAIIYLGFGLKLLLGITHG